MLSVAAAAVQYACMGQSERQVVVVPEEAGSHPSASPLLQQPHLVELLCSLHPAASLCQLMHVIYTMPLPHVPE